MATSFWTEVKDAKLKELWADGHSAALICNVLGAQSRSAVIGRIYRLNLSGRTTVKRKPTTKKPRVRAKLVWNNPLSPAARAIRSLKLPGEPLPPAQETDIGRKQLAALGDNFQECRWPCIEPAPGQPQMFCAAPTLAGLVYCLDHARRAYQPPAGRAPAPAPVPTFSDAVKEDA